MAQDSNEVLTLDTDSDGKLYTKCQATDYILRGEAVKKYNIVEYFIHTYEDNIISLLGSGP